MYKRVSKYLLNCGEIETRWVGDDCYKITLQHNQYFITKNNKHICILQTRKEVEYFLKQEKIKLGGKK